MVRGDFNFVGFRLLRIPGITFGTPADVPERYSK
jgi:hypothetical protein